MNATKAFVAVLAISAAGCSLKPQLVKHYSTRADSAATSSQTLKVYAGASSFPTAQESLQGGAYSVTAFVTQVPPKQPGGPFVAGLSDRGQAELISQIGRYSETSNALSASLLKAGEKEPQSCSAPGPLKIERRLVLSLAGRHLEPATRFDGVAYVLTLDEKARSKFVSWNRFESTLDNVSLGTTRLKQSQTVGMTDSDSTKTTSAATALVPGKELLSSLNLTASQSRELEETVASSRRFTPITGSLSSASAAIVQQGAVGLDLFGNMTADFTLEMDSSDQNAPAISSEWVYTTAGLFKDDKPQTGNDKITVTRCERFYASKQDPITATLTASAVARLVTKGKETAIEGDDASTYQYITAADTNAAKITLVDTGALSRNNFYIAKNLGSNQFQFLVSNDYPTEQIVLPSLDQARDLLRWLRLTDKVVLRTIPLAMVGAPDRNGKMPPLKRGQAKTLVVVQCRNKVSTPTCGVVWE